MDILTLSRIIIRGKENIVFPLQIHSGWISDQAGTHLLDVRGWGHFQYADNDKGAEIQDAFGEWVVKALNEQYEETLKTEAGI